MTTSEPKAGEKITGVRLADDSLSVDFLDGRSLTVPLAWYPRLLHASMQQRNNFRIIGGGFVINWPDVDEHLSCPGLAGWSTRTGRSRCAIHGLTQQLGRPGLAASAPRHAHLALLRHGPRLYHSPAQDRMSAISRRTSNGFR
jgi:hypothetical protein